MLNRYGLIVRDITDWIVRRFFAIINVELISLGVTYLVVVEDKTLVHDLEVRDRAVVNFSQNASLVSM